MSGDRATVSVILTAREAAAFLRVGRSTLPRLIEQEALPFIPYGVGPKGRQMLRFNRDHLEQWLATRSVQKPQARRHPWEKYQRRSAPDQP